MNTTVRENLKCLTKFLFLRKNYVSKKKQDIIFKLIFDCFMTFIADCVEQNTSEYSFEKENMERESKEKENME